MIDIIVVGASDFGRELAQYVQDAAERDPKIRLRGFLDDDPEKKAENAKGPDVEVIDDTLTYTIQEHDRFLIAPGDPAIRKRLSCRLAERGGRFFTLIHPTAYVAPTAKLGEGCIIGPFANVGSFATISDHVLLNLYASAGHDTKIGSWTVISPYASANGGCLIEEQVFFGSHAVVTPNKRVGAQSRVAAGAVVYRDVPELSLAAGNPAKTYPVGQAAS